MSKAKATFLVTALATTLFISGCSQGGGLSLGEKVATIDGTVITRQDYDAVYNQIGKMFHLGGNPEATNNPMIQETLKRMALNKLILNTLIKNDATKAGISISDNDVQQYKAEQVKKAGGPDRLKQFLEQNQMSEKDFDDTLKEQVLINKFLEQRGGDKLKISDAEAQTYYNTHPTEFNLPETFKANHILIKAIEPEIKKELREKNPKITDEDIAKQVAAKKAEAKAKAGKIFEEVRLSPNNFGELAKKYSDDVVSAKNGGDLDKLIQQTTDPAFWSALQKTKPGTLYPGVLETQFGYHILQVKDHIAAHKMSFEEAKKSIADRLSNDKKQYVLETWVNEKRTKAQIVIEPKYQPQNPQGPQGGMAPGGAPGGMPGGPAGAAPSQAGASHQPPAGRS